MGRKVTTFAARPQQPPLEDAAGGRPGRPGPAAPDAAGHRRHGRCPSSFPPARSTADGATSICLVASDLTELEASANSIRVLREHQQALEESEARFRTIFESSQDAIVVTDDEGVYVQANPAVADHLRPAAGAAPRAPDLRISWAT